MFTENNTKANRT